ncbi:MAG: bifunctional phosphopantothenoylcysteine decarboxylase/phosphopantothenate--cysteine ligase CoaBC [Actinomycetales bacterium]|nr:MAG: bifunctional phosphopantothenoylcysteine decarboxylase/phosphopantothenate--cysteine ligase CoaBC [Actinomycetales bacterium]
MTLLGRELILGVGGGISAYKSAELLRRLQDIGFGVTVIPTRASLNFVGTATWEALSGRPVTENLWNNVHEVPHIRAARNANLIVVAPATADLLAKVTAGLADDLLTNVLSATTSPVVFVPAMHPEMWVNSATMKNVAVLRERGYLIIEPDEGRMTGDDFGIGRYPEVSRIISEISAYADLKSDLLSKKILVTAGGTREAIDPVRFIGNHSSGKQGYAIAKAARNRGAQVVLISANSNLPVLAGIETIFVTSTVQMQEALNAHFPDCDLLFMAAAVADARPVVVASDKLKKASYKNIKLEANPDLIFELSKTRRPSQILIAFAAETGETDIAAAKVKMSSKGADLLYLNDVSNGSIFGSDKTAGKLIDSNGAVLECEQQEKDTLADLLLDQALTKLG